MMSFELKGFGYLTNGFMVPSNTMVSVVSIDSLVDATDLRMVSSLIFFNADFIEVHSRVSVCRDKKDNFLLELCVDGKADYLITGDEDLLTIRKFKKTSIIKIADYLRT